jgi:hypothetical protein
MGIKTKLLRSEMKRFYRGLGGTWKLNESFEKFVKENESIIYEARDEIMIAGIRRMFNDVATRSPSIGKNSDQMSFLEHDYYGFIKIKEATFKDIKLCTTSECEAFYGHKLNRARKSVARKETDFTQANQWKTQFGSNTLIGEIKSSLER